MFVFTIGVQILTGVNTKGIKSESESLYFSGQCFVLWPGVVNAVNCKSTLTQWLMGHIAAEMTNKDQEDHEIMRP